MAAGKWSIGEYLYRVSWQAIEVQKKNLGSQVARKQPDNNKDH